LVLAQLTVADAHVPTIVTLNVQGQVRPRRGRAPGG
jgi:hypothetical protein